MLLLAILTHISPVTALAKPQNTTPPEADIELLLRDDGSIEVTDKRELELDEPEKRTLTKSLVRAGNTSAKVTYEDFEAGELQDDGTLLRYDLTEEPREDLRGSFSVVEQNGSAALKMVLHTPGRSISTYYTRYIVRGAVERWSDVGELFVAIPNDNWRHCDYLVCIPTPEGFAAKQDDVTAWSHDDTSQLNVMADGTYRYIRDYAYPSGGEHETLFRAIFPSPWLMKMKQSPELRGPAIRLEEETQAEELAQKEREKYESRQREQEEHEQHNRNVATAFVLSSLLLVIEPILAFLFVKSNYDKYHPRSVISNGLALLNEDLSPLEVAYLAHDWSLTTRHHAVSLAGFAQHGIVTAEQARVTTFGFLGKPQPPRDETVLAFRRTRFARVHAVEERITLDFFTNYVLGETRKRRYDDQRSFDMPGEPDPLLVSDLTRVAKACRGEFIDRLRPIESAVVNACGLKGLYQDAVWSKIRTYDLLVFIVQLIFCVAAIVFAFITGEWYCLLAWLFVVISWRISLFTAKSFPPRSPKAMLLLDMIEAFENWLDKLQVSTQTDTESPMPENEDDWAKVVLFAFMLEKGDKIIGYLIAKQAHLFQNPRIRTLAQWHTKGTIDLIAQTLNKAVETAREE